MGYADAWSMYQNPHVCDCSNADMAGSLKCGPWSKCRISTVEMMYFPNMNQPWTISKPQGQWKKMELQGEYKNCEHKKSSQARRLICKSEVYVKDREIKLSTK